MIISKAVVVPTLILDLTMAVTVGFALGYGVRRMDFPPASAGGATATGPRRRLLALSPRRGAQGAFHAPECYLNLLAPYRAG